MDNENKNFFDLEKQTTEKINFYFGIVGIILFVFFCLLFYFFNKSPVGATDEIIISSVEKEELISIPCSPVEMEMIISSTTGKLVEFCEPLYEVKEFVEYNFVSTEKTDRTPFYQNGLSITSAEILPNKALAFYAKPTFYRGLDEQNYLIKTATSTVENFELSKNKFRFFDVAFATTTVTTTQSWNPGTNGTLEYLLIAGGGGGGIGAGGGGGAGGYLVGSISVTPQDYNIIIGAGGASRYLAAVGTGFSGNTSSFIGTDVNLIAIPGGGGASVGYAPLSGYSGGSGGGATTPTTTGASGTAGQGNKGGDSKTGIGSGCGGGATTAGGDCGSAGADRCYGGTGATSTITGTAVCRAGGGGSSGVGGLTNCGGGAPNVDGTANTGGGGGAWTGTGDHSGAGGSGIMILVFTAGEAPPGVGTSTPSTSTLFTAFIDRYNKPLMWILACQICLSFFMALYNIIKTVINYFHSKK